MNASADIRKRYVWRVVILTAATAIVNIGFGLVATNQLASGELSPAQMSVGWVAYVGLTMGFGGLLAAALMLSYQRLGLYLATLCSGVIVFLNAYTFLVASSISLIGTLMNVAALVYFAVFLMHEPEKSIFEFQGQAGFESKNTAAAQLGEAIRKFTASSLGFETKPAAATLTGEAKADTKRPRAIGLVVLGLGTGGLLIIGVLLNAVPSTDYGPIDVPILIAMTVIGLLLVATGIMIAMYKRTGLFLGLISFSVMAFLTGLGAMTLHGTQEQVLEQIVQFVLNLAALYYTYKYLTHEPQKSYFT